MQQLINAVVLGSIYCLFAVGLSLTWGTLNVLNLAHGSVFMFSAFSCYLVTQRLHADFPIGVLFLIAVAVGAILELVLDLLIFRPLKARSKTPAEAEVSMLIGSIGASAVLVTIAQRATTDQPFTLSSHPIQATVYHLGSGVFVTSVQIAIVVIALAFTMSLAFWIRRTRTGRAMRAIAYDSSTSGLMGINESRISALALVMSGMSAGAAGVFLAVYLTTITPESGSDLLLKAFAAVVLGGVGSIWGTLAGAFILAAGETAVNATTSGVWTDAVSFGLIIVVLLVRPSGLFGARKGERA